MTTRIMSHSRVSSLSPGRIVLGYAVIAILWIAFSDAVVTYFKLYPAVMTIKGIVFVCVTASLLYFTIRRLVQTVQLTSRERDETAELYRTVVEASNEGVCLLDESGRISFLNGRLAAMLGRPPQDLQGKRLQDFIEEPHVLAQLGTQQQSETRECRLRKDSDSRPWVLISRHPVLNDAGEVVRLVITIADISERKRVEQAMSRSDVYVAAAPGSQENLTESQLAGPLRYALAILSVGVALAAALLLQYFHFRDAAIPLLLFAVAISSWYGRLGPAVLAAILSTIGFYWYFIEPVRTIYIYSSNVPYFIIFVAFTALISWFATIRRRDEAGLNEQAALLNLTHDAVLVMDMEGVIRYWNRGAEERYGWPAEKAVGKVVHDLLKTVFPSPLEEIKAEVTRTGRWEGELLHTTKHGNQLVLASRWSLQRDRHGAPVAVLEINNDISERKRAEEALSRSNRELRAISDCNQVLLRASDEESLLRDICRIIYEEAGYHPVWVGYVEHDDAKSVRPVAWAGADEAYLANARISWSEDNVRGRGPTGTAIRSGKTCCCQDFVTDPLVEPWRELLLQDGFRSAISLPLKDEHANVFGCLSMHSERPQAFAPEETRLLEELAGDMAFGIVTLRSQAARKLAEETLRRSEAYLAEAQRLSHTGSWGWNAVTGVYDYWSEETLRIYGFDPQVGLANEEELFQRIHPEDRHKWRENFEKSLREKLDTSDEYRIVLPDGTVKHIHAIRHPVLNEAGDLVRFVGTSIDITERKRAEEALSRSESYLAEAQRLTHTGSWALDVPSGNYVYCSEEYIRISGFDPQQGLPAKDQALQQIHPDDVDNFWQVYQKLIDEKVDSEGEYRIVLPDGTVKYVHAICHPVLNANGELVEVVGTTIDITERKHAEEALRRSEAYLAESERLSHTGSWALDLTSGRYLYVSQEDYRIWGLNPQDGLPTTEAISQRIHPEDRARWKQNFENSLREKADSSDEYRIVLPDGTVKHIHTIRHAVRNNSGDPARFVGTTADVTERKLVEDRLRRTAAYLAETQRLTRTGTYVTDHRTKPVYWSEELFRIFGFDPQHGLPTGEQVLQRLRPEDRDKFQGAFDRAIHGKVDADVEYRIILPDGTPKDIYGIGHPVLNANSEVVEVVGMTVDISERKRAEEALRESETRFRTFVDHAGDALFVYDLEQRTVVDVNRSACESLGYTRQELIGTTTLAYHLDGYEAEMESIAKQAAAGETVFDTHWHRRKDGSTFPVEVHTSLVSYGGGRFLLMVARDITDRVRAEEQRDKLRQLEAQLAHLDRLTMLGELSASIAHEVNQPLSGVVSNASASLRWLSGDVPNLEEAREAARRIVRDGKRAGGVIARIRALTKKAPTPREKLDLNETLRQVLALIGDQAKRNRVLIRTQFADDLSPISGDQVQLQQVALNLAMNALDAMSNVTERERELVITTRNIDTDQVQVTVEDSGVGLDPNTMQKIFEPFYTTKPKGMGMGLSISRSILQSHGGRLWASAKDGPGTTFCFTLPKYHEEESHAGVSAA
jgi:PAS domain S-box-containing protein